MKNLPPISIDTPRESTDISPVTRMIFINKYFQAAAWAGFLLACTLLGAMGLSVNSPGLMQPRNDSFQIDYPAQVYIESRLNRGELPLWNPYQAAGTPFLATLQHRFFYPPLRILVALFGTDKGMDLERVLHYYLAFIGPALLFLRFKLLPGAAFAGALLAGAGINHYCVSIWHANIHAVFAWGPFAVLVMADFHRRAGMARVFLIAPIMAMLVLGGYPPASYFVLELIALMVIVQWGRALLRRPNTERRRAPRIAGLLGLGALITALLCAAALIPATELARQGLRAFEPISVEQIFAFPEDKLNLMHSLFNPPEFLLPDLVPGLMLFVLLLSGTAAFVWLPLRRRAMVPLVLYFIYIYLVCLGPLTPFGSIYKNFHPVSSLFRHPNTALSIVAVMCGLICALGLHGIARKFRRRDKTETPGSKMAARWALTALLLVPTALVFHPRLMELPSPGSLRPFLLETGRNIHAKLPAPGNERITTICKNIAVFPCSNLGMVVEYPSLNYYDPQGTYRSYLYFQAIHENLDPEGINTWLGSLVIDPFDVHAQTNNTSLLELAGVRYVLSHPGAFEKFSANAITRGAGIASTRVPDFRLSEQKLRPPVPAFLNLDRGDPFAAELHAFRLTNTMPRAFLHNRIRTVSSFRESARLLKAGLNPGDTILIEGKIAPIAANRSRPEDLLRPARITRYEPELVEITVDGKGESVLVLTDQFFPGWRAYVNDHPTPIFAAHLLFRAVRLNPGRHVVRFVYEPWWRFTATLHGPAWIICLLIGAWFWFRRRRFARAGRSFG